MAIVLRYFADLSYAEIGEVLGVAEGTVAATLSQAVLISFEPILPHGQWEAMGG
jgi:DNA-directed RNA polymerase specialized sigma24 family protein